MILRHDLRVAFLHIPKCAGNSLRQLFKRGGEANSTTELWDYHYNRKLHRYVDLAHLPADDLAHFKAFRQLRRYRTVTVSRHPISAWPQRSKNSTDSVPRRMNNA